MPLQGQEERIKDMSLSNKFKCINLDNTNPNLITRIFSKICN